MAGADVAGAPKHLYVAGVTVEISGTLPRSAALFDPRAAALPLDEVLLVRLTAPHLAELDQVEREEAVVNAVFLEPNESVVDRYVTKAQEAGLFLVPERLSASQARSFSDMLATSTRYLMAVSAFGALALFAFFGSVSSTITKYRGAFVIYRLYGAGRLAIWARVAAFLASVCLCLPLLPTLLCMVPGPPFSWGALCSIGILLVVFLAVFTQTVWKISRLDGVVEGG
jgi:hypothetical protein